MSIFRRDNDPQPEPVKPAIPARSAPRPPAPKKTEPSESTHVASGSRVIGKVSGNADLVIDGIVEGEIELESQVVIGTDGRVEGKILARSVEVGGKVLGNVQGVERVEVLATGSLEGDVLSPRVVIAEGAFFKGKVEMTDKIARSSQSAPPLQTTKPAPPASGSRPPASGSQPPASGSQPPASGSQPPAPTSARPAAGPPRADAKPAEPAGSKSSERVSQ